MTDVGNLGAAGVPRQSMPRLPGRWKRNLSRSHQARRSIDTGGTLIPQGAMLHGVERIWAARDTQASPRSIPAGARPVMGPAERVGPAATVTEVILV